MRRVIAGVLIAVLMGGSAFSAMQGFNINSGLPAATMTLSAVGSTPCIPVISLNQQNGGSTPYLQPAILTFASGTLTYSVEVTGDDLSAGTPTNYVAFTNMSGLSASAAATLGAAVTCIRLRVTAYTSGSVLLEVVQQVRN